MVLPTPVADVADPNLVMGMGWGLFAVLLLGVVAVLVTILGAVFTRQGVLIGMASFVTVLVFFVILTQCPTESERADVNRVNTKTDDTAQFRLALVITLALMVALSFGTLGYYRLTSPIPFMHRPKRGKQTYKKFKASLVQSVQD
eukprot:TRINITY_DN28308_c0_g1_i1.p2 TRINITY_DN28308_c0_g1~~TRINITY_DN28308_c0_g1_i1.p2  ORF type:complete len:145 (+),score=17.94 TRINITY_DN28308_c0_g1_i1:53-487(+)